MVHRQRVLYNVQIISPAEEQSFAIMYKWSDLTLLSMHCIYGFVHVCTFPSKSHWVEVIAVCLVKASQDTTCCCLKIPSPTLYCFAMNTLHFVPQSLLPFCLHSLHISATSQWESKIHMHGRLLFLVCHTFLSQHVSAAGVSVLTDPGSRHLTWITCITLKETNTTLIPACVFLESNERKRSIISRHCPSS